MWGKCVHARRVLVGAVVVNCLVLAAAAASAQAFGIPPNGMLNFSDSRSVPASSVLANQIASDKPALCKSYGGPSRSVGTSQALSRWQAYVQKVGGKRGMSALEHSSQLQTAHAASAAAAGAVVSGDPGAALAFLFRAHQLSPKDPRVLVDAAPLLTDAGHADDALALLAAASRMKPDGARPYGASLSALIDTNRGYALLALGQAKKAIAPLKSAVDAAPLLREAKVNLAAAEACNGNTSKSAIFLAAGGRRGDFKGDLVGGTAGAPTTVLPPDIFDLSKGQKLTLKEVDYPQSMQQAYAMRQADETPTSAYQTENAQWTKLIQESDDAQGKVPDAIAHENAISRQRTWDILNAVRSASYPDITSLYKQVSSLQQDIDDTQTSGEGPTGYADCTKASGAYGQILTDYEKIDGLVRRAAALEYYRRTGLAANLSNTTAHEAALAYAREEAHGHLLFLLADQNLLINLGNTWGSECYVQPSGDTTLDSGNVDTPESPDCPPFKVGPIKIFALAIDFDCEEVKVEGELDLEVVKWFVKGTYNHSKGELTVMTGPKVAWKQPGAGKLSTADGIYVTVGTDGTLRDAGARVELSGKAGVGPISVSKSDAMDFSVVGIHPIDDLVDLGKQVAR